MTKLEKMTGSYLQVPSFTGQCRLFDQTLDIFGWNFSPLIEMTFLLVFFVWIGTFAKDIVDIITQIFNNIAGRGFYRACFLRFMFRVTVSEYVRQIPNFSTQKCIFFFKFRCTYPSIFPWMNTTLTARPPRASHHTIALL